MNINFNSTDINPITESTAIWFYDSTVDHDTRRAIKIKLSRLFRHVKPFDDEENLKRYLNNKFNEPNIRFIISGNHSEELCRLIARKPENYNIYELNMKLTQSIRKSSNTWVSYSNVNDLIKALEQHLKTQHNSTSENKDILNEQNHMNTYRTYLPSLGILDSLSIPPSFHFFDKDSSICLLFQLLTKILVQTKYGCDELNILCVFCRDKYKGNDTQIKYIETFRHEYCVDQVIQYYTKYTFLFLLLTKVCQCEDTVGIYKFRRYIYDLYKQLKEGHQPSNEEIILYRGKKLPSIVLQQLKDLKQICTTTNPYISINGFLSTTKDRQVAENFADIDEIRDGYETTIFILKIKQGMKSNIVYTDITPYSCKPDERETLFSLGSVWKLLKIENNNSIWSIELELTNEFDDHLNEFDNKFLNDHPFLSKSSNAYLIFLLAKILYELGRYSQSAELYHDILKKQDPSNEFKCLIFLNLATMRNEQGEFSEAKKYLENVLELYPSKPDSTKFPSKMIIMYELGSLHKKTDDYKDAEKVWQDALTEIGNDHVRALILHDFNDLERIVENNEPKNS